MQIKEFEALSLKECLQRVRDDMGPEAVILETRKFRKGGVMGLGAKDAVCIVAATGITVQSDSPASAKRPATSSRSQNEPTNGKRSALKEPEEPEDREEFIAPKPQASANAARAAYARSSKSTGLAETKRASEPVAAMIGTNGAKSAVMVAPQESLPDTEFDDPAPRSRTAQNSPVKTAAPTAETEVSRFAGLERAMQEIRESLLALKNQHAEHARTMTAVVTAVSTPRNAPEENAEIPCRFPELQERLMASGISPELAEELLDSLPDFDAWSTPAQKPMAEAALRDLMSRRIPCGGPIQLTPGKLKAVALIGPTGVGKTTTIAKLAAHFSLVEGKKVALLTVDTYRIAAVEQLKTYSQIIDIPVGVAYSQAEVLPAIAQFADYDLLLIDTAGRSQKNIMQVGELKALLEALNCETHLVLSAPVKESDMVEAARRFSAACVDRVVFTKLDETGTYGTLLNVAERTGIPLSYVTTGQKVPEDIETASGKRLAELILGD